MSIDKTILKYRKMRGLTQVKLAEKAEVSQAFISKLEKGQILKLKSNTLEKLARALEVRMEDILMKEKEDKQEEITIREIVETIIEVAYNFKGTPRFNTADAIISLRKTLEELNKLKKQSIEERLTVLETSMQEIREEIRVMR